MAKPDPLRREFLQLADKYAKDKSKVGGFYLSEKLDGTRCFWDGGITRGMKTEDVPWASVTDPKKGGRKKKIKPRATGLWSRYGNPIIAPDEFLNELPCCPLDGELWAGVGNFQLCRSICGGDTPDPRFMDKIVYAVYSAPTLSHVFRTGHIKNANMVLSIDYIAVEHWIRNRLEAMPIDVDDFRYLPPGSVFEDEVKFLADKLDTTSRCYLHPQKKLPSEDSEAARVVEEFLEKVLDKGGEGVVIRNPKTMWMPTRHRGLLKYKPYEDAEGTLVGFTSGRETNKGSRLQGMIGALILDYEGVRLELSGLTDDERQFTVATSAWASAHPGVDVPSDVHGGKSAMFTVGQLVSFKYRELSDEGVPKEARYHRVRDEE